MTGAGRRRRLFFALWPPAGVADRLYRRAGALDLPGRAVARDKLHLTLAFHGDCDQVRRARLMAAADTVDQSAFTLTFDRLGCFRRSRILWFGSSKVSAPLARLAAALAVDPRAEDRAGDQAGESADRSAFVPHVTVARGADPVPGRAIAPVVWIAREFALVESGVAGQPGAYRTLARWPLAAGRLRGAPD